MKSSRTTKTPKPAPRNGKRPAPRNGKRPANGKARGKRRKPPLAGGSGRIPAEILETPGPACPGIVETLLADRR